MVISLQQKFKYLKFTKYSAVIKVSKASSNIRAIKVVMMSNFRRYTSPMEINLFSEVTIKKRIIFLLVLRILCVDQALRRKQILNWQ